jgi:outer membrane protein OmpA-like peptidoglycan-associated protein
MEYTHWKSCLVIVLAGLCFIPASALAMGTQEFYGRLVKLLKASQVGQMERLVKDNRNAATKCLEIIREKLNQEKDQRRAAAYQLLADELDELIAVTSGERDCEMAEKIYQRGLQITISDEALEVFRRVVRLCPERLDAYLRVADLSKKLGRFDEAVSGYKTILARRKDSPDALMGLGETLFAAGLYRRCIPYFQEVLAAQPDHREATKYIQSASRELEQEREGTIPADEIVERLWAHLGVRLMCMCPYDVQLKSRVRLKEITFATDSTRLNRRARAQIAELARAFKTESLKDGHFLIEGHADPTGSDEYNQALAFKRAQAVKRCLVRAHNIDPALLSVAGIGESRPWTTNDTSVGRKANRRIEVISIEKPSNRKISEKRPAGTEPGDR